MLTKNDDLTLRRHLTSSVSMIFASTISVLAGYRHFQTNNRASGVICIQVFNKNIFNNYFKSRLIPRQISICNF